MSNDNQATLNMAYIGKKPLAAVNERILQCNKKLSDPFFSADREFFTEELKFGASGLWQ